jgi:glycosyltransferase involved in cell wall biosynthesis
MRIAIVAHSSTRAGGVETYLAGVIPGLAARGHEVACWFESAGSGSEAIVAPFHPGPVWTAEPGVPDSLQPLRRWKPDVIYHHGLRSVPLERQLIGIGPVAFFAHSYYGSCISGGKSTRFPVMSPCSRAFGPVCLAHYLPQRCGGLSPATMVQQYVVQRRKQELLHEYDAVLVASAHMSREYEAQRIRTCLVPLPVVGQHVPAPSRGRSARGLLYLGRLERSKGVTVALQSAAHAAQALDMPLRLVVAGNGSLSESLQRAAARLMRRTRIAIEFPGWLTESARAAAFAEADLLLVPSLWPEPFGLVGIEAASAGVPAIAFRGGGIDDWLRDGVNGRSVPLAGDRIGQFAGAIVETLSHPDRLEIMRRQAFSTSRAFSLSVHIERLEPLLRDVAGGGRRHVRPA